MPPSAMKLHAASTSSSLLWIPPNTLPTTAAGFELVLTVRSLGLRLSKLSVAGEGEDGELAEGEIAAAS